MGFWSGVKGFFAGKSTVDKALDAVIDAGDALVYTTEEEMRDKKEVFKGSIDALKVAYARNDIRSLTRRYIAIAVIGVFLLFTISWVFLGGQFPGLGERAKQGAELLRSPSELVLVFYFSLQGLKMLGGAGNK